MELPKGLKDKSVYCDVCPNSFDLCLVDKRMVFVKFRPNADKLTADCSLRLRAVSHVAQADPVVVSLKSGSGNLEDGVLYSRRDVPVLTPNTLEEYVSGDSLPRADKGGLTAEIDNEKLTLQMSMQGVSRSQLAQKLGVSREMIRRYESGQSSPSLSVMGKILELFGEDLLTSSRDSYSPLPDNPVSSDFRRMGLEAEAPLQAPFDVIARGRELMLGLVEGFGFERKIGLLDRFSELLGAHRFIIGECEREGIPVIKRDELHHLGPKELLERLK